MNRTSRKTTAGTGAAARFHQGQRFLPLREEFQAIFSIFRAKKFYRDYVLPLLSDERIHLSPQCLSELSRSDDLWLRNWHRRCYTEYECFRKISY